MVVLYDPQIFGMQDYGGISRYFFEIIRRMPINSCAIPEFVHHNEYLNKVYWGKKDNVISNFKYKNYLYTAINIILGIPKILSSDYKIFHPTYYETYFVPFIKNKKLVITIHDLVHEKYSYKYPGLSKRVLKQKALLIKKADHIIAVSENTKKDIEKVYGVSSIKISVVYHGNSLNPWNGKKSLDLPSKYLLFVGQRSMYKNFNNFIRAVSIVIKKNPEYSIICAGGGGFTDLEKKLIEKNNLSKKIKHVRFNSDESLAEIYSRATVFVYPSLYEGFGIPILEAFSSKTPIAISNTSCFPEIAGNAAEYFDPQSPESISDAILNIIYDDKRRRELITLGNKQIEKFSWGKAATQTMKIYSSLIHNK